jgi:hypothetical protein
MEEEAKEEKKETPRFKRRVSLFRKRKKPKVRSTVKVHSHRNYTKLITNIVLILLGLFILTTILFILRRVVLPKVMNHDTVIINPQGATAMDNNQVRNIIENTGLVVEQFEFATNSAYVTFTLNKTTQVLVSLDKDIRGQMDLVEAVDKQIKEDGKQAIYIDLRYNKPVVKF